MSLQPRVEAVCSVSMYWNVASPYNSYPLADPSFGLSDVATSAEDEVYSCTFHRQAATNISVPNTEDGQTVLFDLDNDKYYLLLAMGPVSSGHTPS